MQFVFSLALLASSLFSLSFASTAACPVSKAVLTLPKNQTQLVLPTGQAPVFIGLGVGTQNYTCTNGAYVSAGAVATLFDISCLYNTPIFPYVQDLAVKLPLPSPGRKHRRAPPSVPGFSTSDVSRVSGIIGSIKSTLVLGTHYFVNYPDPSGAIAPQFDFTKSQRKADAFVTAQKKGSVAAKDVEDVAFLQLNGVSGNLAKTVFRVDTALGQPPSSCTTEGELKTVKYAAKYWGFA
ncbi:hypothetical protein BT69DRAFT_1263715 [Atractiella rhizophila]|nr:hypothetical protein BT69DRAFT_1263715 [Atractiella rhizophila]